MKWINSQWDNSLQMYSNWIRIHNSQNLRMGYPLILISGDCVGNVVRDMKNKEKSQLGIWSTYRFWLIWSTFFLPAGTLGAVRSTGAKVCSVVFVRPLLVQPYIIFACMVFCGYLDIWTADVNFGKMII